MAVDSLQLNDLSYLLNKEHIIATFTSEQLSKNPSLVEHNYSVHAKTHIPLGDTGRYVDTIAKWVRGQNKGAFIGGVTGDYGEGKTSFLVHAWEQAAARDILAVPPFSWRSVADLVEGVHAWASYKLKQTHPEEARAATKLWEEYRQKTLEEQARAVAKQTNQDIDTVLQILSWANTNLEVSIAQFLDYCAELSKVIAGAGYKGVLVLLDEPEVTAKGREMSTAEVAQILFDIANGLLSREGNYGVFVSIPENFMAQVRSSFSSLEPRLQGRQCFVSLGGFYNNDFAATLWNRYAQELDFASYKHKVISPLALEAVGQVTSSTRRDLSYGPRTVITVFRRAVEIYQQDGVAYSPQRFVKDVLEQEVSVRDSYEVLVRQNLNSAEAQQVGAEALTALCAFPDGIHQEKIGDLGLNADEVLSVARPGHPLLYRRAGYVGLHLLQKQQGSRTQQDLLQQHIEDIMGHYAPRREVVSKAVESFAKDILPIIFKDRQGQALVGWKREREEVLDERSRLIEFSGAFEQTKAYPMRKVYVVVSDPEANTERLVNSYGRGEEPDILVHVRLHWSADNPLPQWRADIDVGDPSENEPGVINVVLNLAGSPIEQEQLERYVGDPDLLTPLAVLYLMNEMRKLSLPQQEDGIWRAIRDMALPKLVVPLFGDAQLRQQASEQTGTNIPGNPTDLIPTLCRHILTQRYPDYRTLMTQPGWQNKAQTYTNVISNQSIPLTARRGQEPWIAPKDAVARAFNTSVMNLTGGWAAGLESLLSIASEGASLRVDFKMHPLEKRIQDEIMSGESHKRRKIDGKECWWIPLGDIGRFMLTSGYSQEELQAVVNIGRSRGTFSIGEDKGKPFLYCLPFDSGQMQLKLREKLTDLREQIEAFTGMPNYRVSVEVEVVEREIEAVKDEMTFDRLQNRLNRVFEQDNARLPHFFEQLNDSVQELERKTRQLLNDLKGRSYLELENPPKFQSSWGSDFSRYIINNLHQDVKAAKRACDDILLTTQNVISTYVQNKGGTSVERARRIAEGWKRHWELKGQFDQVRVKAQNLDLQIKDYEKWRSLLIVRSDVLHQKLLKDREDLSHQAKADQFLEELEAVWGDISAHLQDRGLSGLGSHKQFEERFSEIEERRATYLQGLKAEFDAARSSVNQVLESLTLGTRCKEAFNQSDVYGCYERLYAEAKGHIRTTLTTERQTIVDTLRELRYAKDVLKNVPVKQANSLIDSLGSLHKTLKDVTNEISPEWVQRVSENESNDDLVTTLKDAIVEANRGTHQARQLLKSPGKGAESLSPTSKEMLELLEDPQDLKAVILSLIGRGHDSEKVLDASLVSLSELFREGMVNIKVEPPRR